MHLLWLSDSPDTPSGFGMVTRFVCEGLARAGHRVNILGWQTRVAADWNGCKLHPTGLDPMGSDAVFRYLVRYRPEVVVALGDVWWLPFFAAPHVRRQLEVTNTPWVLYFPIDGDTADQRLPRSWVELLQEVDIPVAMSRYGQRVVNHSGVQCEYIPHGVDLDVFCPPKDREQAKARIGAEGKFLVLSDSRNQPRKMLPRLLEIFSRFAATRPDALLHLHTDPNDEFAHSEYYSYDVRADAKHLGIEGKVHFSPGFVMKQGYGLPLHELATYYQAADVHLLASSGEGFGLPTLQAAAAGAVPLAAGYSASRELVEGHGEAIEVAGWTENEFGIRRALIDIDDAVKKLVRLYDDRQQLREQSQAARDFALSYGWKGIVPQWHQLLRSIESRRLARAPYRLKSREEKVVRYNLPSAPGCSIVVRMAGYQAGKLEATITADVCRQSSDIRIPVLPRDLELEHVRVPRRSGYVCLAPADAPLFFTLRRIFPILAGWIPVFGSYPPKHEQLVYIPFDEVEETMFELAQSALLLNTSGSLPESMLINGAVLGTPCIGTADCLAQTVLWPELAANDTATAVGIARSLFSNAAQMARVVFKARAAARHRYAIGDEALAALIRSSHARQQLKMVAAGG